MVFSDKVMPGFEIRYDWTQEEELQRNFSLYGSRIMELEASDEIQNKRLDSLENKAKVKPPTPKKRRPRPQEWVKIRDVRRVSEGTYKELIQKGKIRKNHIK
jgi:hypothetical protein